MIITSSHCVINDQDWNHLIINPELKIAVEVNWINSGALKPYKQMQQSMRRINGHNNFHFIHIQIKVTCRYPSRKYGLEKSLRYSYYKEKKSRKVVESFQMSSVIKRHISLWNVVHFIWWNELMNKSLLVGYGATTFLLIFSCHSCSPPTMSTIRGIPKIRNTHSAI